MKFVDDDDDDWLIDWLIESSRSKSNFKDHYGDAATEQCLGMIAEINAPPD